MPAIKEKMNKNVFNWFVVKLLTVMFLIEFVKGALLISILPVYMKEHLSMSAFMIGLTLSFQYVGDNAFRGPNGWLIDKIGYRYSMLAGAVMTLAGVTIITFASHFAWIALACALLGIGTSPLWPCVITGATEVSGERALGQMMSVVYLSWLCGVGLGPVVINLFIATSYGPAFRILIGMMLAVLVVVILLPNRQAGSERQPRTGKQEPIAGPAVRRIGLGSWRSRVKQRLRRIKQYLREADETLDVSPVFYPAMFAQTFALGLLVPVLTLYARTVLNLTPLQYSMFLVAGGAVTVLTLIPVGKLVDVWGVRRFLVVGLVLSSAVLLYFTSVRSIPLLFVLVALLGFGYALIIPSWNALIGSVVPQEKRGAIWGFFLTIEGAGTVLGTMISGKLWDSLGHQAPFIASGSALLCLLFLQMFITTNKKVVVR